MQEATTTVLQVWIHTWAYMLRAPAGTVPAYMCMNVDGQYGALGYRPLRCPQRRRREQWAIQSPWDQLLRLCDYART